MSFDWKAIVGLIIILYVFTYAGLWWGILSVVIVTVALGWKNRHDGPFPTNGAGVSSEVKEEAERLLKEAKELDKKIEKNESGESYDELVAQAKELGFMDSSEKKTDNT